MQLGGVIAMWWHCCRVVERTKDVAFQKNLLIPPGSHRHNPQDAGHLRVRVRPDGEGDWYAGLGEVQEGEDGVRILLLDVCDHCNCRIAQPGMHGVRSGKSFVTWRRNRLGGFVPAGCSLCANSGNQFPGLWSALPPQGQWQIASFCQSSFILHCITTLYTANQYADVKLVKCNKYIWCYSQGKNWKSYITLLC